MNPLEKIKSAKHITLLCDEKSFANACALYTYILTLHKKVSLVSFETIPENFTFLSWYDKLRKNIPSSSDMIFEVNYDTLMLFDFFKTSAIKINQKMATALCAGVLIEYNNFKSSACNAIVFAAFSELILLNAAYKECVKYLQNFESLSLLRLKAILYRNMCLCDNATVAQVYICDSDFKRSGADMKQAEKIMYDFLSLAHVVEVRLLQSDKNNEILKSIKEN